MSGRFITLFDAHRLEVDIDSEYETDNEVDDELYWDFFIPQLPMLKWASNE